MSISVNELIHILPDIKVIAGGEGVYRMIGDVIVVDVPDGYNWIRGHELIITSGYIFHNTPEAFFNFVKRVTEKGAAGIAFKSSRQLVELSGELIDYAERHRMPILDIPPEYYYADIMFPIMERITMKRNTEEYRDRLVLKLISNQMSELDEKIVYRGLGWRCENGICVLTIQMQDEKCLQKMELGGLINRITEIAGKLFVHFTSVMADNRKVFLLEPNSCDAGMFGLVMDAYIKKICDLLKRETGIYGSFALAYGRQKAKIQDAYQSYRESVEAIRIGELLYGRDFAVSFDELGIYRLLLLLRDTDEAADFVEQHLGKLLAWDQAHGTDYLGTLAQIIRADWNLKEAAEKLYIHYNTMKNRYQKIWEICGVSRINGEQKRNMELAHKLLIVKGKTE